MEISVIVFPGSNCDRDVAVSLKKSSNVILKWYGTRNKLYQKAI